MIGRFRAAWDDSRRAANTRRGSNPMSREEWFELQDRIANLVTGESLSIHLSDYRRHIERCIESQFRLHEARTRSDEPLTRRDVEAIAVNAAGDLIGKAFLGSASPDDTRLDAVPQTFIAGAIRTDSPDANARRVTGAIRTDDGDGVVREWNPETYEHTATRRTGVTPILGDGPITRAEATAIAPRSRKSSTSCSPPSTHTPAPTPTRATTRAVSGTSSRRVSTMCSQGCSRRPRRKPTTRFPTRLSTSSSQRRTRRPRSMPPSTRNSSGSAAQLPKTTKPRRHRSRTHPTIRKV